MPILNQMLAAIKEALESTPPELSADLVDMGLVLTGGGALLKNIDKLIEWRPRGRLMLVNKE